MKFRGKANKNIRRMGSGLRLPSPWLFWFNWLWPWISFWALWSTPRHSCYWLLSFCHEGNRIPTPRSWYNARSGGFSDMAILGRCRYRCAPMLKHGRPLRNAHRPVSVPMLQDIRPLKKLTSADIGTDVAGCLNQSPHQDRTSADVGTDVCQLDPSPQG